MINAKKLIWAREQAGLSQKQVAAVLSTHPKTVSRWEQSNPEIPDSKLVRFMQLVNVSPADLPDALKAPVVEAPVAGALPAGYDTEGYPLRWGRPTLRQFANDEAMNACFLQRLEGAQYKEREAYRVAQRKEGGIQIRGELLELITRELRRCYPAGVPTIGLVSLMRAQAASAKRLNPSTTVPAEQEVLDHVGHLCGEGKAKLIVGAVHLAGGDADIEAAKAAAELADPGGVKRKAAAELLRVQALADWEAEQWEEQRQAEIEAVRAEVRRKQVEAKAAKLLAAAEEEKRFRAERAKGEE